ncbi:hypothetical protein PPBDW_II0231 [Photobacterium kishitanii]|nr:hypothetical protein PPBDW_II0231 [Photobacterium kishitanii]
MAQLYIYALLLVDLFGSIIPKYYPYILYPAKDLDCVMKNCAIL